MSSHRAPLLTDLEGAIDDFAAVLPMPAAPVLLARRFQDERGDDRPLNIAFDRAFEPWFRFEVDDATAQLRGHLMRVILGEIEFLSDLLVRQIEN